MTDSFWTDLHFLILAQSYFDLSIEIKFSKSIDLDLIANVTNDLMWLNSFSLQDNFEIIEVSLMHSIILKS